MKVLILNLLTKFLVTTTENVRNVEKNFHLSPVTLRFSRRNEGGWGRSLVDKNKTQIHLLHQQKAKMAVFADFEMPLWYKGVIPEHLAVRNRVGIFDVSHMGRIIIKGPNSERFLNFLISNDVSKLTPLSAQYSVMCNENGGIIDDLVVYSLEEEKYMMVYNASNREKNFNWISRHAESFAVTIEEISDNVAMFAVQGPYSEKTLKKISAGDVSKIGRFKAGYSYLANVKVLLSRTGYTGEDGFEIFVLNSPLAEPGNAITVWNAILDAGKTFGIESCGLGARDTLRLEAGMCLYGNDIDETITPLEARLGFVVKLSKVNFIGKNALEKQRNAGVKRKRVGIKMLEPGIPRPGYKLFSKDIGKIGKITSGTFSPLLKNGIGMGYVQPSYAKKETGVKVKIRDRLATGEIAQFPFYNQERYGYKRKNN
jgi:aminomethyltransferase